MVLKTVLSLKLTFSLLFILFSIATFGASCCGGSGGPIGLILNDSKAKLNSSYSYQKVIGDVNEQGVGKKTEANKISKIYALEAAYLLSDYWQVGFGLPYYQNSVQNSSGEEQSNLIGDISSALTYEYLPETYFSKYRPRGLIYSKITAPTGRSNRKSRSTFRSDITGQGHYVLALGFPFYKIKSNFDFLMVPEIFYKFKDKETEKGDSVTYGDCYGYSFLFSFGFSPWGGATHLGLSYRPQYQSEQKIIRSKEQITANKYFSDVSINVAYAFNNVHSLSFVYSDQSVLGPAKNTALVATFGVNYIVHWPL